ncbi:endonuclease-reverse transcriptase [Trichonephila clavipes]|nr:endonuclease-reverse transcriptase [Trichonephila clavipes]
MPFLKEVGLVSKEEINAEKTTVCVLTTGRKHRSQMDPQLYIESIVKFIATQRLKWAGHLIRLDENRVMEKIFVARPYGTRKRGRPRLWWIDCLEKDLETINVRNWKRQAKNKTAWNGILKKAKVHPGVSCH